MAGITNMIVSEAIGISNYKYAVSKPASEMMHTASANLCECPEVSCLFKKYTIVTAWKILISISNSAHAIIVHNP